MQKRQQDTVIFRFFTKQTLLIPFLSKTFILLKHAALMPTFCQKKRPFSQKHYALRSFYFNFFIKNPLLSCPYVVPKRKFCQNYTISVPEKSIECLFFPICHEKPIAIMPILCQKRQFSIKHTALMPIFCQKTSTLSKTQCSHVIFFKFFMKNPLLSCPYQVKKTSSLTKIQNIMGQKSQQDALFFSKTSIV